MRKKVQFTRMPTHPLFIGPLIPLNIRKSLYGKNRYRQNRKASIDASRKWYQANKETTNKRTKEWRKANLDRIHKREKVWRDANRARLRAYNLEWRTKNRERLLAKASDDRQARMRKDPAFRVLINLRSRIGSAIKRGGTTKCAKSIALLGATPAYVRVHLENQFADGMSWDNYGTHGWHIDHIIPCVAFDLTDPDHQKMCFHYTNLRPMWARDNHVKGDNLTREAIQLLVG